MRIPFANGLLPGKYSREIDWRSAQRDHHMNTESPESAAPTGASQRWLSRLGSLKLTLAILLLLLAGGGVALVNREHMTWLLVLPLALFALNLGAALLAQPTFRRQTALLVFHLALLAIVLLVAAARLTYLKGQIEVTEGTAFDGHPFSVEAGPWHHSLLDRAVFENLGFASEYVQGSKRISTRNHVRWTDEAGRQREAVIGDLEPLRLHGYSISPDLFHMGFATVFAWLPEHGAPERGAVLLPAYPANKDSQVQEWTPPGRGEAIQIKLQFDQVILDPARSSEFRPPREHSLLVQVGAQQHTLVPGGRLELSGGTLVYEGLRRWMGYTVTYDWSTPWLLAAGILAIISLAWHFWSRFAANPWLEQGKES